MKILSRMAAPWSQIRLPNRFIQGGQELRIIFAAFINAVAAAFPLEKNLPGCKGQTPQFLRVQVPQLRLDLGKTRLTPRYSHGLQKATLQ